MANQWPGRQRNAQPFQIFEDNTVTPARNPAMTSARGVLNKINNNSGDAMRMVHPTEIPFPVQY